MIEFFIVSVISSIIGYFFLWINVNRLIVVPLSIVLLFVVSLLGWFSIKQLAWQQLKRYWSIVSRSLILIGVIIVFTTQWLAWYHIIIIVVGINVLLYLGSYQRDYEDGKTVFARGIVITFAISLWYNTPIKDHTDIARIISIATCLFLILSISIPYIFPNLSEQDKQTIANQKEKSLYASVGVLLYRIFQPNFYAIIVTQITFATLCIALRQTFLTRQIEVKQEKKVWLSGRALLSWQKVLERYDNQNQSFDLNFFNFLIWRGIMPSTFGMIILQYSQLVLISLLVITSIWWLFYDTQYTLVRYRLGVISFLITMFWVQSQEGFVKHYKTIAIVLITWSYYITLFEKTRDTSIFTRWSLLRLTLNMITLLFYKDLLPKVRTTLTKSDIILWLTMIILGWIITTISLVRLPLNGSLLFALGCIIIGMIWYFSYNIRLKINS